MTLAIDLVPHMDAGDRTKWPGDQDERPLSELGRRQALALDSLRRREDVCRGLTAVQVEWSLVCTAHNLLKLHKALATA